MRYVTISVVFALCCATAPRRAHAHEGLQRSVPAKDAVLTAAPTALRLTFTSAPTMQFTRVQLLGPGNVAIPLGVLRLDSVRTVVADIQGALSGGTYTVVWQVAGADGHPVRGRYAFRIAAGATGLAPIRTGGEAAADVAAPGAQAPPAAHHDPASMPTGEGFDAQSPAYVAIRWLTFLALASLLGIIAFQAVVLPLYLRRADQQNGSMLVSAATVRSARFGVMAAGTLVVAALVRLYAQSYAMHGATQSFDLSLMAPMISQTVWGWGWLLQLVAALVAITAFVALRRGRGWAFPVAALAVLALAFTPALSGHAASAPRLMPLAILADGIHVLGAGGWLGSLLALLTVGIPVALSLEESQRGRAVADLVNAFSPTTLLFAGLSAATGVFAAWLHVETFRALWESDYGRILLLKLGILSIVAGTGAYNWLRVRPALGGVEGATRIRRSATVELAVGAVVLLITAALVATPTPMDMTPGGE